MERNNYDYPVFATQGGGLAREVNGTLIFVERPDCPGLNVGDIVPEQWGIIPANQQARKKMERDDPSFSADLDLFFDLLLTKVAEGRISPDRAESFFPKNTRDQFN